MEHYSRERRRKLIRLKGYDYSNDGCYFITICTKDRECLFGEVRNKKMILNNAGFVARKCWLGIPNHFPNIILNEFITMPNHVHGILVIDNAVGVQNFEPLRRNRFQKIIPRSIGSIIRGYKIGVTKWFRQNTDCYDVWQRLYYDHIIRNERSLDCIREYIRNNPGNWKSDRNNILNNKFYSGGMKYRK